MSGRRQVALVAAAAVGVALAFFLVVVKPKVDEISKTRGEVAAAHDDEESLRARIAGLEKLERNAPALLARLQGVSSLLPSTPDLPNFIRLVQGAATQAGIDLRSIAPSPPSALDNATGIDTITVTLVVSGGFNRMQDFLARVERLRRIVLVTGLSLSPQPDPLSGRTVLQATVSCRMYVVQPTARVGAAKKPSPSPEASP